MRGAALARPEAAGTPKSLQVPSAPTTWTARARSLSTLPTCFAACDWVSGDRPRPRFFDYRFSRGRRRGVDIRGGNRSLRPLHTWIHAGDGESPVYQLTSNAHLPHELPGRLVGTLFY